MRIDVLPPVDPGLPGPAHELIPVGQAWYTAWAVDPQFLIPVVLAGAFYARGLMRWTDRSREHPWWRTAFYFSGLALLVLALQSPIDRMSGHHFTMHMLQHELIMMLAIPLILLGAPTTPSLLGMPRWLRMGVVRPLAKQPAVRALYSLLTHPVTAVVALNATLWMWHLMPGWYERALQDDFIHDIQHLTFAGAAALFWWNVIDPKPLRSRLPYVPRILYVFAGGVPKHFLGAMLTFSQPLYDWYAGARPILDLTLEEDQALGGLIMWVPSSMMTLGAMGIIFAVWWTKSEAQQRKQEAAAGVPGRSPAPTTRA